MTGLYPDFFTRFYDLIYHQVRDGSIADSISKTLRILMGRYWRLAAEQAAS